MGSLICAGALLLAVFGFSFYSYSFSLDRKKAVAARSILTVTGFLGVLLVCLSSVLFFLLLANTKGDALEKGLVDEAFWLFIISDTAILLIGAFITLAASFMKSVLRPVILIVLPLWGIIMLFWTAICSLLADFEVFCASPFVIAYGTGTAFVLAFAALPQMIERIRVLSDPDSRGELIKRLGEKRAMKEGRRYERKRLRDQKKRLKHPKRK